MLKNSPIAIALRVQFLSASRSDCRFSGVSVMSEQTRKSSQRLDLQSKIAIGVLAGWLLSNFSAQAIAADLSLGNGGIKFTRDTTLEPSFLESHGAYQSTFGVINLDTNEKTPLLVEVKPADAVTPVGRPSTRSDDRSTRLDFPGTPGNAVPQPISKFKFRANNNYAFYLESTLNGRPSGIVYSTDKLNPNTERQVVFAGQPADLCNSSGMLLAWDDTGSKLVRTRQQQDRDFDDFIVRLRDSACAPGASEPPGVVGSGTSGGSLPGGAGGGTPSGGGIGLGLGALALGGGVIALLTSGDNHKDSPKSTNPPGTNPPGTNPPGTNPPGTNPPGNPPGGAPPGEPIPTPSTFLGSTMALGFVALMRRRQSKRILKK